MNDDIQYGCFSAHIRQHDNNNSTELRQIKKKKQTNKPLNAIQVLKQNGCRRFKVKCVIFVFNNFSPLIHDDIM